MTEFANEYAQLEDRFRLQAESDGDVFLPNTQPIGPVDVVLIAMEPSLKKWAVSNEDARAKIAKGYRNFMFSIEDFIVHFCVRRFACHSEETYHLTDISKGAMPVKKAKQNRSGRYRRWYGLLRDELSLVAKPETRMFAVGRKAEKWLHNGGFKPPTATLLHYSGQAAGHRKQLIRGREREFADYTPTIDLDDIRSVARDVMAHANLPSDMVAETLRRFHSGQGLTESRKMLIFAYKVEFERSRRGLDLRRLPID